LKRKRRGGGERKRKAKHAAAGRQAREDRHKHGDTRETQGGAPGLFGFLNQALGTCAGVCMCVYVDVDAGYMTLCFTQTRIRAQGGAPGLLGFLNQALGACVHVDAGYVKLSP
jgi:hypothetical protein